MVVVEMTGWGWDVLVCQDCASASQVERDEDDDPDVEP
jgi:hypothetical protein